MYCSDGNDMPEAKEYNYVTPAKYAYNKVVEESVNVTKYEIASQEEPAEIQNNGSSPVFLPYSNPKYKLVGPYEAYFDGQVVNIEITKIDNEKYPVDMKNSPICDSNGNIKSNLTSGEMFYLKVTEDTEILGAKLTTQLAGGTTEVEAILNGEMETLPYGDDEEVTDVDYFLVGPFNVIFEGEITSIKIVKNDNQELTVSIDDGTICDENANPRTLESGENFYLKVKKELTEIKNVKIKVEKKTKIKYKVSYTLREEWTIQNQSEVILANNNPQKLHKKVTVADDTTDEIEKNTSAEIKLKGVKIPTGTLIIKKLDKDTNATLKGYTVKVSENKFGYEKTFKIISDQLKIENIPSDTEYTVTEIIAPSGYKLDLQIEEWREQKATVETDKTVTVTLYDRQFGDLIVQKVDKDKYESSLADPSKLDDLMLNLKFIILFLMILQRDILGVILQMKKDQAKFLKQHQAVMHKYLQ